MPGKRAEKARMAAGMSVRAALPNEASRSLPMASPAKACNSVSAATRRSRIESTCPTSAWPASVSRTALCARSSSITPHSRSSAARCWEVADVV